MEGQDMTCTGQAGAGKREWREAPATNLSGAMIRTSPMPGRREEECGDGMLRGENLRAGRKVLRVMQVRNDESLQRCMETVS